MEHDPRAQWNANAPAWTEMARAGHDRYRDLVNTPAFFELLPSVDGLAVLDLGCGEGHNTRLLAGRGARVIGLDVAEVFLRAAASASPGLPHVLGDGQALPLRDDSVDAVTAFMSLMDLPDPESALQEVARVLRPGGFVQLSVGHPASATPVRRWVTDAEGVRVALTVGGYFEEGPLTETWTFSSAPPELRDRHRPFTITYARRTLGGWLRAVLEAGLVLEAVAEPHADEATAAEHPEVADTRVVPYFLILRARRP